MKRGEWDHQIVAYGRPGCGKSTLLYARAKALGRTPAYVLVHDPKWTLGNGVRRFKTEAEFFQALKNNPRGELAIPCADGNRAAEIAKQVGQASLETPTSPPVVLLLDEGVAVGGLDAYRLGDSMRQTLAMRRHYHLAILVSVQSPTMAHKSLNALATEVIVFNTIAPRDLRALEEMGFPAADLDRIRQLPKFKYATLKVADGTIVY